MRGFFRVRVVVLVLSSVMLVGCAGSEGSDSPESISAGFDNYLDNAPFYMADQGVPTQKVSFTDGVYAPKGAPSGAKMRIDSEPVYSDIDFNGDMDAAVVLEWTGTEEEYGDWKGVYAWLWEDGSIVPAPWPLTWQWNCVADYDPKFAMKDFGRPDLEIQVAEREFGETGLTISKAGNYCGAQATPDMDTGEQYLWIEDGYPAVAMYQHAYSPAGCWRGPLTNRVKDEFFNMTGKTTALRYPQAEAPQLTDQDHAFEVYVWKPEMDKTDVIETRNGYVKAVVRWDKEVGCGWVPAEDVEKQ